VQESEDAQSQKIDTEQIEEALADDKPSDAIELVVEHSHKSEQIAQSENNSEVKKSSNNKRLTRT